MKKNIHNFYKPDDVLYLLENKTNWLTHYEFHFDGLYFGKGNHKVISEIKFNWSCYKLSGGHILTKITGKTYDWFL